MTGAEWLTCADPEKMLVVPPVRSPRKLRLFAVACCARIDRRITDPRSRAAVDFLARCAELPVNRQKGRGKVFAAAEDIGDVLFEERHRYKDHRYSACIARASAADAAAYALVADPRQAARDAAAFAALAAGWQSMYAARRRGRGKLPSTAKTPELAAQADLAREIFGNPFHPVAFSPEWRTDTAVSLARQMYESREFGAMPILADALQDAGCDSAGVLDHCRDASATHVRGCWVVDLVLGKE